MRIPRDQDRDAGRASAGVLSRSVTILDAVEAGAHTFTDIATATGFPRATTHRLVKALEAHGFLAFVGGRGYRLGPRLLRLAGTAARELPLRDLARPSLERLAEVTGESAQLFVRSGAERICVDAVESRSELRTIVPVGASLPLTAGSAGKVLLAWSAEGALPRLRRFTDATVTDAGRLRRQLDTIRRRGWAESVGEREAGVASVSAPVLDAHGSILAAVSVSGPIQRLGRAPGKRYAAAVTAAASEIESAVGGP